MRSKPARTRCKPPVLKAFTLIELIVTVAVLCLIAGLQLAANPHGKGQSETAICAANLRRLGQAWLMYAADNNGSLPGNYDGGSGTTNQNWCVGWQDFSGHPDNTNVTRVMQSQLGKYAQVPTIYRCPADPSLSRGTTGQPRVRSVSMNGYIGNPVSPGRPYTPGYRNFMTLGDFSVLPPAKAFVFTDEREDSINDATLLLDMGGYAPQNPAAYTIVDYPADWHDRGANLSFADGHVETWHWQDSRTTPLHRPGMLIPLVVSSPHNPDVARLQDATSRPLR
jgi:prepilin-type processing-associated H-X9-DG protein/prepilin-type N-terminal cleavage/methylation domain-containing protein